MGGLMGRTVVGKNVDSWCTRCKLMLAHTLEALVDGKITRVHCNTCGAQHAYRPAPPRQRPAKRGSAPAAARSSKGGGPKKVVDDYQALLAGRDPSTARRYATSTRFAESDLIDHPVFGLGVVTVDRGENKIQVAFPDKERTLIHAY